jgi:hypothetical protein
MEEERKLCAIAACTLISGHSQFIKLHNSILKKATRLNRPVPSFLTEAKTSALSYNSVCFFWDLSRAHAFALPMVAFRLAATAGFSKSRLSTSKLIL